MGLYTVATRCHTCFAVTLKYTEDSSLTILRHSLVILSCCCRGSTGTPWIGAPDVDDNDEFVWLNGKLLPEDDENWRYGCLFLITSCYALAGVSYHLTKSWRGGGEEAMCKILLCRSATVTLIPWQSKL